ncbi:MAG: hypothetical protein AB8U44_03670 [Aaplasma endosymbiont of Hyalomma asiaticum]
MGLNPDHFYPVNGRNDEGSMFAVPEILVGLVPALEFSKGIEFYRIERWERVWGNTGYIVGYVRKEAEGVHQMCACTKLTSILSQELMSEIDTKRVEDADKITNYDNLDLDIKIENACKNANTYVGCFDIGSVTPSTPVFPKLFIRESRLVALPMEFSKQSYFDPGLRMMRKSKQNGSERNEFVDLYRGEYDGFGSGPRGRTRYVCNEMLSSYAEIIFSGHYKFNCNNLPVGNDDIFGHAVERINDEICLFQRQNGALARDCVPFPSLPQPVITESNNGLNIKFPNCFVRDGKQSKYCDFSMMSGDVDKDFGFEVIKPKLNLDKYDLELTAQCMDSQGKVLPGITINSPSCKHVNSSYEQDQNSNVKCFVTPKDAPSKFYVKRNNRFYWLQELPRVLVASSFDHKTRKHAQCDDSKSMDISLMKQDDLDKISIRGRVYYFDNPYGSIKKDNSVLCQDNMSYKYSNDRVFLHDGVCGSESGSGLSPGYCKTRYNSLDNFEHFFLQDDENPRANHVFPLNPMFYGMCVSNFPEHEYKYVEKAGANLAQEKHRKYIMEVSSNNAKCDLLKVELWGGGEAGLLTDTPKPGRPGEYVMGIFKLSQKDKKYLTIKVGRGGVVNTSDSVAGISTEVSFCDDASASSCGVHLVAKGGGNLDKAGPIVGLSDLVHYRVSEGRSLFPGQDKVLIPYQDHKKAEGIAEAKEVGCERDSTDKSTAVKVVSLGPYPGAGGCARPDLKIVQGGSHGMVKVTCEKWSGDKGAVTNWEAVLKCDQATMAALEQLKRYTRDKSLSNNTKSFFSDLSIQESCASLEAYPLFSKELIRLSTFIKRAKKTFSNKNASDRWIKSELASLDNVLIKEPKVPHFYSQISKTKAGGGINPENAKARIYSSFTEIIRSRINMVRVPKRSELDKILERLSNFSGKHNLNAKYSFDTLRNKRVHGYYKGSQTVLSFFRDIDERVNNIGSPKYVMKSEDEARNFIEAKVGEFKNIMQLRKSTLALYERLYANAIYKKTNAHRGPETIDVVGGDFRAFMRKLVAVEARNSDALLKALKRIAEQAEEDRISFKDVFIKIANKKFADNVVRFSDFEREIIAVEPDVSAGKNFYVVKKTDDFEEETVKSTQLEVNTWIDHKVGTLKQIIEQHPTIVQEYVNARYPGIASVGSVHKEELLKAYRELLKSRSFMVDEEILNILKEFQQYSKDAHLSGPTAGVFEELCAPRTVERISSNKRLYRLIKFVRDVKHEGKGFNTADRNAPEAQRFWSVIRAMESQEGEILLGYSDRAKQVTLKNAFSELLDNIAAVKIEKQIDGEYVLAELNKVLGAMSQRGKSYDPLLKLFWDQGSRVTMKRSNCFSVGIYNFVLGLRTILKHSTREYFPGFIVQNIKESILFDIKECIKNNVVLLEDALNEQITKKRGEAGMLEFVDSVMGGTIEHALNMRTQPKTAKELRLQMEKVLEFLYHKKSPELHIIAVAGDEVFLENVNLQWQGVIETLANVAEGPEENFVDDSTRRTYIGEILNSMESALKSSEEHEKTLQKLYALQQTRPELLVYPRGKDFATKERLELRAKHVQAFMLSSRPIAKKGGKNAPSPLQGPLARFLSFKHIVDNGPHVTREEQLLRVVDRMLAYSAKRNLRIDYAVKIMRNPEFLRIIKGTEFARFMHNELLPFLERENIDPHQRQRKAFSLMETVRTMLERKENFLWLRNYAWFYTKNAPLTVTDDLDRVGKLALGMSEDNIPFGPTMAVYHMFYVLLTK